MSNKDKLIQINENSRNPLNEGFPDYQYQKFQDEYAKRQKMIQDNINKYYPNINNERPEISSYYDNYVNNPNYESTRKRDTSLEKDRQRKYDDYDNKERNRREYVKALEDQINYKNELKRREKEPIETTGQLVDIIEQSIPMKARRTGGHPAKRTFQAFRIAVNHELDVLSDSIDSMIDALTPGGRLCIITFQSLEDRIVKQRFKINENPCTCPPDFPVCVCGKVSKGTVITKKPIIPTEEEMEDNPRSKSSKLRIFCKSL